jgi:hypothetical protein
VSIRGVCGDNPQDSTLNPSEEFETLDADYVDFSPTI